MMLRKDAFDLLQKRLDNGELSIREIEYFEGDKVELHLSDGSVLDYTINLHLVLSSPEDVDITCVGKGENK